MRRLRRKDIDLIESDSHKFDFLYDLTAMGATILIAYSIQRRINKYGLKLLGEDNYVNKLAKSVEDNITSEMGLALGDVADVFRDAPSALAYLEQAGENLSLDELREINGAAAAALDKFLRVYGVRCAGEIDITRTRFIENPAILSATLSSNIKSCKKGQMREEFAAGKHAAQKDTDRLLAAVQTRYGKRKARKLASDIKFYRDFVGLREAPKFFWIHRLWSYKKVLIEIADDLVRNGVIDTKDDIYYLYMDELRVAIATHKADKQAIAGRRRSQIPPAEPHRR
ncbi:MAG: hypothetical protein LBQ36_10045 [Synergistaceae bacterium]|jgi:pyruvate,water dikinase|nr:hypothetical protein [Synergistaceae bacterium]